MFLRLILIFIFQCIISLSTSTNIDSTSRRNDHREETLRERRRSETSETEVMDRIREQREALEEGSRGREMFKQIEKEVRRAGDKTDVEMEDQEVRGDLSENLVDREDRQGLRVKEDHQEEGLLTLSSVKK